MCSTRGMLVPAAVQRGYRAASILHGGVEIAAVYCMHHPPEQQPNTKASNGPSMHSASGPFYHTTHHSQTFVAAATMTITRGCKNPYAPACKQEEDRSDLVQCALDLMAEHPGAVSSFTRKKKVGGQRWFKAQVEHFRKYRTMKNVPRNRKRTVLTDKAMSGAYNLLQACRRVTPGVKLLKKAQRAGVIKRGGRSASHFMKRFDEYAKANNLPLKHGVAKSQPPLYDGDAKRRVKDCTAWLGKIKAGQMDPEKVAHADQVTRHNNPPPKSEFGLQVYALIPSDAIATSGSSIYALHHL